MGLESLVPLVLQGGAVVAFMFMWWFTRQDLIYEREQRRIEREVYERRLREREDKFDAASERGLTNAHATTIALNAIRDVIVQGRQQ
jgi:hypothetical protein